MKRYSPGSSRYSDYYYICDCCRLDDGRPTLIWSSLPKRKGHFVLCFECLTKLFKEYIYCEKKPRETIIIKRVYISEALRNSIFERDGHKCINCEATNNLQIDHIIPFILGGQTTKDNLQTLCSKCNRQKGKK